MAGQSCERSVVLPFGLQSAFAGAFPLGMQKPTEAKYAPGDESKADSA